MLSEKPFLDSRDHPARRVEAAAEAALQQPGGLEALQEGWGGDLLTDTLARVAHKQLSLLDAYKRLLPAMARTLQLPPDVFQTAALAQDDSLWPEPGSTVVYVRGHCDLREQSLSRGPAAHQVCVLMWRTCDGSSLH